MAKNEISLDEYLDGETKKMEIFKKWWAKKHAKTPKYFPMKMGEGDWDEQFSIFDPENPDEPPEP